MTSGTNTTRATIIIIIVLQRIANVGEQPPIPRFLKTSPPLDGTNTNMMRSLCSLLLLVLLGSSSTSHSQADAALRPGDAFELRIAGVPSEEVGQVSAMYTVDGSG